MFCARRVPPPGSHSQPSVVWRPFCDGGQSAAEAESTNHRYTEAHRQETLADGQNLEDDGCVAEHIPEPHIFLRLYSGMPEVVNNSSIV